MYGRLYAGKILAGAGYLVVERSAGGPGGPPQGRVKGGREMARGHRFLMAGAVVAVGLAMVLALSASGGGALLAQGDTRPLDAGVTSAQAPVPGAPAGEESPLSASSPQEVIPGGPGFQMVSALQFKPWHPTVSWDFYYLDLYNPGPEFGAYSAALTLPDNVTITRMVVYFYDNSVADLDVRLWLGDQAGGWGLLADVYSSGALDGYRTASDDWIDYAAVDQQSYSYALEARLSADSTNLRLAGVRIDYAYSVDLPLVLKGY
jgi:hypothetical protein